MAAEVLFGAAQLGHEHHAAFKGMSIEGMEPCVTVESRAPSARCSRPT
jgi:hypothetical protein